MHVKQYSLCPFPKIPQDFLGYDKICFQFYDKIFFAEKTGNIDIGVKHGKKDCNYER
jgi:hypothetical protein